MTTARKDSSASNLNGEGSSAMTTPSTAAPLWSVKEVSEYLGIPVQTLYQWRYLGLGPRAYRCGRHLRYDPAEVARWLTSDVA